MTDSTMYFVGIDLHKSILQACVLGADGKIVKERRFRGESLEDGLAVVEWLSQWKQGGRFCVEAVGMNRRVAPGRFLPRAPTDPDVRD